MSHSMQSTGGIIKRVNTGGKKRREFPSHPHLCSPWTSTSGHIILVIIPKVQSVFVQISKCICPNCNMYLFPVVMSLLSSSPSLSRWQALSCRELIWLLFAGFFYTSFTPRTNGCSWGGSFHRKWHHQRRPRVGNVSLIQAKPNPSCFQFEPGLFCGLVLPQEIHAQLILSTQTRFQQSLFLQRCVHI